MPGARILATAMFALLCAAEAAPAHALQATRSSASTGGQVREVVSKQIDVSRRIAALRLEFADDGALDVEFRDGTVRIGGDEVGRYRIGDALETAWRALLGEAVSLDDGPLAERLREWSAPAAQGDEAELARLVDEALERSVSASGEASFAQAPRPSGGGPDPALALLFSRPRLLLELARAIQDLDLDESVRIHVNEDVTVAVGQTVPTSIIVWDGDLDVQGDVEGSVVIVGGTLRLAEGGRVADNVRLADARIIRDGGAVLGNVADVVPDSDVDDREQLRGEIEELRAEVRRNRRSAGGGIAEALGGVIKVLLTVFLVAVLGGGLAIHFAREELDVITETARRDPLRAGMVGFAGAFLTIPAWLLGGIALVVTIVGILALPFWIVLFPVAIALAMAVGYLAVSQALGEWVARQRYPRLEWVRMSNPYSTMIAGVGVLMLAQLASDLIGAVGFLRFASLLLALLGGLITVAAVLVGFGALLLTRGGRRPEFAGGGRTYWGDNWDDDLGFGEPPPSPSPEPSGPAHAPGDGAPEGEPDTGDHRDVQPPDEGGR